MKVIMSLKKVSSAPGTRQTTKLSSTQEKYRQLEKMLLQAAVLDKNSQNKKLSPKDIAQLQKKFHSFRLNAQQIFNDFNNIVSKRQGQSEISHQGQNVSDKSADTTKSSSAQEKYSQLEKMLLQAAVLYKNSQNKKLSPKDLSQLQKKLHSLRSNLQQTLNKLDSITSKHQSQSEISHQRKNVSGKSSKPQTQVANDSIRKAHTRPNIPAQDKKSTTADLETRLYKLKSLPTNYAELSFSEKVDALDAVRLSTPREIENVRREMIRLTPKLDNITQADTRKFNQLKSKVTRAESQIRATQGGKVTTANLEARLDQLKGLLPKNYANLSLRGKVNVLNNLSLSTVKQVQLAKQATWKLYVGVKNSGDTKLTAEYNKLQPKLTKQLVTLAKDPQQAKQMNFKLIQLITSNDFATKEICNIARKTQTLSQSGTTSTTTNRITNPRTNQTINSTMTNRIVRLYNIKKDDVRNGKLTPLRFIKIKQELTKKLFAAVKNNPQEAEAVNKLTFQELENITGNAIRARRLKNEAAKNTGTSK
ncbi:MAG: hypothetical protein OXC48_09235 [Endozoicomonadaceae bacterium]|nr:hypothetical protein [Endozoicomonadaceae bacterium]